jgi:imidazolonepropionase-like amidohydrolase
VIAGIFGLFWAALSVARADCTVIDGADVYFPDGHRIASVAIVDGRISTTIPATCTRVDGNGRVLTAGLIESSSEIGITEIDQEDATTDGDSGEGDPIRAALQIADAYNPRSTIIPVVRIGGVTSAVVHPSGGLVSGQSAFVDLAGVTQAETVRDPSVAINAGLGANASRAADFLALKQLLDEARRYGKSRSRWAKTGPAVAGVTALDLEALQSFLSGETPLVLGVDRAADIERTIRFARDETIRVIVHGGAEGWLLASELAAAKIPVILDPLIYGAGSFDQVHGRPENAALLDKAGVKVIIASFQTHNARTLRQVAGNAVRAGLPHEAAIRAITQNPADAFGQVDHGRIADGAVANVVLWSGDPLENLTRVEAVWIGGRSIPLESRQTELLKKYRTLPASR